MRVLCGLLGATGLAAADTTSVEWTAPAECPDRTALMAELGRLLGEAGLRSGPFTAVAQVTSHPAHGFELELHFSTADGSGTRHFQAADCHALVRLAAFSIALAIDPTVGAGGTPPPPPASADPAPTQSSTVAPAAASIAKPSVGPIVTPSDSPSPPAPQARDGFWLGAQVVGDSALMPHPGAGLSLWGHRSWSQQALRLGLSAEWFLPQSEVLPTGGGGEFSLWLVEARGCYGRGQQLQLALCPTLTSGLEIGEGIDVEGARTQRSWFLAPGLALLGVARPGARWLSTLEAQVLFPFPRDEFVVRGAPVHRLPTVSLQISVGFGALAY